MADPVITLAPQKPLPKWVKWLGVIAVSCAVIFAIVLIGYELRYQSIRQAEMPVFKSLEQELNGFEGSGATNASWTASNSQSTYLLLSPYYLSDDMDNHPKLVGIVPPGHLENLMWKNMVEMPLLIGFRDGVLIDAVHVNSGCQWSGNVLIIQPGDQLALQRAGRLVQISISSHSK